MTGASAAAPSGERRAAVSGGIELAYETFGSPDDPAMLLVMGLGTQMLEWDEEFCALLVERGCFVIRFDNRDVGRSTVLDAAPEIDVRAALAGDYGRASYTLAEMASDAVGLLDHLGVGAAHVVGVSMGGMIAQTMAIRDPERLLSLTSIMSTTGEPGIGQPHPEVMPVLLTPAPAGDAEAFAEWFVRVERAIGSPGYPSDEAPLRRVAGKFYARGVHPAGTGRQLLAILASGDRTPALRELDLPTLVIHGEDDPLIDVSGGVATAAAVPGARLETIAGMGHNLPRQLWPELVEGIVANAARRAPA